MADYTKFQDRCEKFALACQRLVAAVALPVVTDRDVGGTIQTFEFTYETAWKLLRAWVGTLGEEMPTSPKAAFAAAYAQHLIGDEVTWLAMVGDRNLTTHTYDPAVAALVLARIQSDYLPVFLKLAQTLPAPTSV